MDEFKSMDITIQKRNAKKFIENWKDRGHEKKIVNPFGFSF